MFFCFFLHELQFLRPRLFRVQLLCFRVDWVKRMLNILGFKNIFSDRTRYVAIAHYTKTLPKNIYR